MVWYVGGLHFECMQCGNCCAGPEEGYIWITQPEIRLLAEHLGMSVEKLRSKYLIRYGNRTSIRERAICHDCIFLKRVGSGRGCGIYPVRPKQCRTWPFWTQNLQSPDSWNITAQKCPGINRGRWYRYEEIEAIRTQMPWWSIDEDEIIRRVSAIYAELESRVAAAKTIVPEAGCSACGQCCNFAAYDHRLCLSTPEYLHFLYHVGRDNRPPMTDGRCPYQHDGQCTVHPHRFAGCRIFYCDNSVAAEEQSRLSEWAIDQFKQICESTGLEYRYAELSEMLHSIQLPKMPTQD